LSVILTVLYVQNRKKQLSIQLFFNKWATDD
jgi:hypothetical protein